MCEPPVRAASCPVTGMDSLSAFSHLPGRAVLPSPAPAGGVATRVRGRTNSHSVRGGFPPPFRVGSDRNQHGKPKPPGAESTVRNPGRIVHRERIRTTTGFGGTGRSLEHRGRRAALPSDAGRRGAARGLDRDRGPSHAAGRACRVSQAGAVAGLAGRRTGDADPGHPVSGRARSTSRAGPPEPDRDLSQPQANAATGAARARNECRATRPRRRPRPGRQ